MNDHCIVHVELSADNPKESAQFYTDLFGWKHETMPEYDYYSLGQRQRHGRWIQ